MLFTITFQSPISGANINAQTEETQETALTLACCGGFLEVADYLLKNGADIELGASTPLMEAAQEGHIELVRFLLENSANVHAQTQTGDTALTYACENGHTDVAEVLLMYGAELEHESEGGRTPLMKACRAGHICTIKFLINKGADVNRQSTSNDHTPLSLACAGGHQAVVELLLNSGADPFHKLKDNSTMLIEASKGGHIGVVQLLLDYPNSMLSQSSSIKVTNSAEGLQLPKSTIAQSNEVESQASQQQSQQIQSTPQPQPSSPIPQKLSPTLPIQEALTAVEQQTICPTQVYPASGLQEVPEAIRVSNQQVLQHPTSANENVLPNSLHNILLNSNAKNSSIELQDSLMANMNMRLLRNQGFKDGLALGLAKFGLVNNNNTNTSNNNGNTNAVVSTDQNIMQSNTLPTVSTHNNIAHNVVKQKSLLRKGRQTPAPFELNAATPLDGTQMKIQPLGEGLGKSFILGDIDKQPQQNLNLLDKFKVSAEQSRTNDRRRRQICLIHISDNSNYRFRQFLKVAVLPQRLYRQVIWILVPHRQRVRICLCYILQHSDLLMTL